MKILLVLEHQIEVLEQSLKYVDDKKGIYNDMSEEKRIRIYKGIRGLKQITEYVKFNIEGVL